VNELIEFSLDVEDGQKNYALANWYEQQNHTAAAHTYYLRASERSVDKLLAYKSLIRASFCYSKQGSREGTEKVLIENALIVCPERPEAYYFLSLIYERRGDWQNCYIYASLGLECYGKEIESLGISEYSGKQLLIFQKAVAAWYWGKGNESRNLFQELASKYYNLMGNRHKVLIDENMSKFGLKINKTIVDCFRFFNEKELLELRYHVLKDHVDKFIILEGTRTQSGHLRDELLAKKYIKELNLPEEKFIVIEVDLPGNDEDIENTADDIAFRSLSGQSSDTYKNSLNARTRERLLLNSLLGVVDQFDDNTVFLVSDCDEIIKPENIPYFSDMVLKNQGHLVKVPLIELQGRANLRAYDVNTDIPASTDNVFFMCTPSHLRKATPFQMRFDINNPFETVYITQDGKRLEECGWHFSWMGDNNRLKLKQKSTSHYADYIESAVVKDMGSEELETFIDQWEPKNNGMNVWGDTGIILKQYSKQNLPEEMLKSPNLMDFFLGGEEEETNVPRSRIINSLIKKIGAKKYLEIGVAGGENLSKIECEYKIGVDPNVNSPATFHVTSDNFFENNKETFDVIFIDGLHHANQVYKDILNSLDVLNDGGCIVCHDMNPEKEEYQIIPLRDGVVTWNGDCWKAFVRLRRERENLEMFVVNTDHGCGIIRRGKQTRIEIKEKITYKNFDKHRKEWLNLIEVQDFFKSLEAKNKIPVLGVPIVNGVHWLRRLIDSIDYPVEELLIVNNNGRDQITPELDELTKINHPFIEKIRVCHLPHNLGVGGAWNLIIKSYLMSPYWIICNNDIAFTPGFLKEMVEKASGSGTEIVWPPSINEYYVANGLGSFECFLLKPSVIEKCGLFDENLYPAYCEDCDYLVKIKSKGILSEYVFTPYYHGETQHYETGSQTLKLESPEVSNKIRQSHMLNIQYMKDTWGSDWENWEKYSGELPVFNRAYDIEFIKQKYLGF